MTGANDSPVYKNTNEPCPLTGCFGTMVIFQGPVFGKITRVPTCSICGYKEAPRDDNTHYISWS